MFYVRLFTMFRFPIVYTLIYYVSFVFEWRMSILRIIILFRSNKELVRPLIIATLGCDSTFDYLLCFESLKHNYFVDNLH